MLSQVDITLHIRNNREYPQQMNILGNPYNPLDTANAKTEYQYNLTGFIITNENTVSLQYKAKSDPAYQTFIQSLTATNFEGVVAALNLLGIGYFNYYTAAGQLYITTNNDNYVFGSLNIYNPSAPPPPVSPVISYDFNTGSGGDNNINVNAVPVVSIPNPASTGAQFDVANGDTIDFFGTTSSMVGYVEVYNVTTSTSLYSFSLANSPFSYSFVVAANNVYTIVVHDNL